MKHDKIERRGDNDLSTKYRPIAISALKAATCLAPVQADSDRKKDAMPHLLLPESLPDA